MILRDVLEKEQKRLNVSWLVLEQDYVLSWMLFGISQVDLLRENLIFKGGTALKKIYFGEYRFSQDLDFSCLERAPKGEDLEKLLREACSIAEQELSFRIPNPVIQCIRYSEKQPHPHGQEAFVIRARLPWHNSPYVRVMVEVSRNAKIINQPLLKNVIHGYPEDYMAEIFTYTLDEIFAEKLLAMLQNAKKLHERKWSRSRVRDYYDLWKMLTEIDLRVDSKTVFDAFLLKKGDTDDYMGYKDFFDPLALTAVKRDWHDWLSPMVYPLPSSDKVIDELQDKLRLFLDTADVPQPIRESTPDISHREFQR